MIDNLATILSKYELTNDQIDKLLNYSKTLLEWNKIHSLTALNSLERVFIHIEQSLYPIKKIQNYKNVLDIGSGAGLPVIPLSIALDNINFIAVEPLVKKFSFLNYIKVTQNLKNLSIIRDRVENINLNVKNLLITSKAVGSIKLITKLSKHINNNGILLYKGSSVDDELKELDMSYEIEQNGMVNYLYIK